MKLVVLTDIHGKAEAAEKIADDLRAADWVLLPGDLTMFGREKDAERILDAIRPYNANMLAVMGNCDYPEVEAYLRERDICLHRAHKVIDGVAFAGLGGSLPCPVPTQNEWSEEQIADHLDAAVRGLDEDAPLVLMSHQPPKDTVVDLAGIGKHVGSEAVRAFIERRTPVVCFSGHIHEAEGEDTIGNTRVVNPGPFMEGRYAVATIDDGGVRVDLRRAPGFA